MSKKSIIIDAISVVLIIIMAVSGYKIVTKIIDYKKDSDTYAKIQETLGPDDNFEINEKELKSQNPDYRMWLSVDNTNISYPVVSSSDNEFYLHKDFYREKSSSGSIFMDYRNTFEYDKNVVLYGHNMRNGTMFHDLENFKKKDFWNKNSRVRIYRGEYEYVYEPFAIYVSDDSVDNIVTDFDGIKDFKSYIDTIISKSLNKNGDINESEDANSIITLSTCSYEFDDARTILHAKLIEKNKIK